MVQKCVENGAKIAENMQSVLNIVQNGAKEC